MINQLLFTQKRPKKTRGKRKTIRISANSNNSLATWNIATQKRTWESNDTWAIL
jgi:hypothetical protein